MVRGRKPDHWREKILREHWRKMKHALVPILRERGFADCIERKPINPPATKLLADAEIVTTVIRFEMDHDCIVRCEGIEIERLPHVPQ